MSEIIIAQSYKQKNRPTGFPGKIPAERIGYHSKGIILCFFCSRVHFLYI